MESSETPPPAVPEESPQDQIAAKARRRAERAAYKAGLNEFIAERKLARERQGWTEDGKAPRRVTSEAFAQKISGRLPIPAKKKLSEAQRKQRRTASLKHGLRAKTMTRQEVARTRLARISPDLPAKVDRYVKAIGGDLSALDQDLARGLAAKAILRDQMINDITERGVVVEDQLFDSDGHEIGRRVRAHPMLEPLKFVDEHLGLTADHMRLSRRSRGQGARDDAIAEALHRDERLRAANRAGLALPAPDPDLMREDVIDTEIVK